MEPISQPIDNTSLAKILSPTSDKLLEAGEDKLYTGTMFEKNSVKKSIQSQ
jgi:hypothetical protein